MAPRPASRPAERTGFPPRAQLLPLGTGRVLTRSFRWLLGRGAVELRQHQSPQGAQVALHHGVFLVLPRLVIEPASELSRRGKQVRLGR